MLELWEEKGHRLTCPHGVATGRKIPKLSLASKRADLRGGFIDDGHRVPIATWSSGKLDIP